MEPVRPWKRAHQETRTTGVKATKTVRFDCTPATWHALERLRERYPQFSKTRIIELIVGQAERLGLEGAAPPAGEALACERCGRVAPAADWPEPAGLVNDPGPRCPACWRQGHGVIPRPAGG